MFDAQGRQLIAAEHISMLRTEAVTGRGRRRIRRWLGRRLLSAAVRPRAECERPRRAVGTAP
jgi:hypothetical protein